MSKSLLVSLKKSDVSDLFVFRANRSKKTSNLLEKKTYFHMFLTVFFQVFPLFMLKERIASVALHLVALF